MQSSFWCGLQENEWLLGQCVRTNVSVYDQAIKAVVFLQLGIFENNQTL